MLITANIDYCTCTPDAVQLKSPFHLPAVDIVCVSIMFIFNYNSGWFPLPAGTVPALSAAVLTAQWNQWPISDVIGTNGGSFAGKYEPPSHSRQQQI